MDLREYAQGKGSHWLQMDLQEEDRGRWQDINVQGRTGSERVSSDSRNIL